ncbi:hypothetical protein ASE63_21510 [Bosea sp. Root381]|nr:hypothetical protein ASE63_21510 [Bosea sp. Root381]
MLRRAAVHEAGHAIAAVALGKPLQFAEIREKVALLAGPDEARCREREQRMDEERDLIIAKTAELSS